MFRCLRWERVCRNTQDQCWPLHRPFHPLRGAAHAGPPAEVPALGREDLDALVRAVADVELAVVIEGDGVRQVELAGAMTGFAPRFDEPAVACEAVHAGVPVTVGHIDVAIRVGDHLGRKVERSRRALRQPIGDVAGIRVLTARAKRRWTLRRVSAAPGGYRVSATRQEIMERFVRRPVYPDPARSQYLRQPGPRIGARRDRHLEPQDGFSDPLISQLARSVATRSTVGSLTATSPMRSIPHWRCKWYGVLSISRR